MARVQSLCHVFSFLVVVCVLVGCSGGESAPPPPPPPPPPTVTISANPGSITLGQSTTITWSSTNATSCSAGGDWSGAKATSGSEQVTPTTTGAKTYTLTCSGAGGATAPQSASLSVATPPRVITGLSRSTIYCDRECGFVSVDVNGSGFVLGDVLKTVPDLNILINQFVSSGKLTVTLGMDTPRSSPGTFAISVCAVGGVACSNSATFLYLGNQNTLARSSAGELFNFDQGSGVPSTQNTVRKFKSDGTPDGNFQGGASFAGIAFDDRTSTVMIGTVFYNPTTGTPAKSIDLNNNFGVMGAAVEDGLACLTQPSGNLLSCVDVTQIIPLAASVNAGDQPWSLARVTVGAEPSAIVYARGSTELRRYAVARIPGSGTGTVSLTLRGALLLVGITPENRPAGLAVGDGGWQLVAFAPCAPGGTCPAAGKAAFLSAVDRTIVLVDLASMTELRRVVLQSQSVPFRIAADAAAGAVVVEFADAQAGPSRYAKVNVATGAVTILNTPSDILGVGLLFDRVAMRDQLRSVPNQ